MSVEIPQQVEVIFPDAIEINGKQVTEFTLSRQPTGDDLGRYTPFQLLEVDRKALAFVTPKLIQPHLTMKQVKDLAFVNLTALANGYAAFLEPVDFDKMATPIYGAKEKNTSSEPKTSSQQKAD